MSAAGHELLPGVSFNKEDVLGEGAYGVVYRGHLGDAPVALKAIKATSLEQQAELEATLLEEAAVWAAVYHPNIVQYYGLHKDVAGGLYLVSELMDGSVESLLHEEQEREADGEEPILTERQKLTMVLQVACALQRLHHLGILHSDLAARNVLYRREPDGGLTFKVTDFGLASVGMGASSSKSYQLVHRAKVPVRWCSPEVLKRCLYSVEGDVWSLGVYAWEVFSLGDLPYGAHLSNDQVAARIAPTKGTFRLEPPEDCPQEVWTLLASCWAYGRKKRITLDALEAALRQLRDACPVITVEAPSADVAPTPAQTQPSDVASTPLSSVSVTPAQAEPTDVTPTPSRPVSVAPTQTQSTREEAYAAGLRHWAAKEFAAALESFRAAAAQGHTAAQYHAGALLHLGLCGPPNYQTVAAFYQQAAKAGNAAAEVGLGLLAMAGKGRASDYAEAARRFATAESLSYDCTEGMGFVTLLPWLASGLAPGWCLALARDDDAVPRVHLAALQLLGLGHSKDERAALAKCRAAGDSTTALWLLGEVENRGENFDEALKLCRKPAAREFAPAQWRMGVFYSVGQGVELDYGAALQWYKKAAAQGHAEAQFNIGIFYYNGQGLGQDYGGAMHWYKKAADKGHAEAQFNIGVLFEKGQGMPQDYGSAIRWYKRAADGGHTKAQYNMGVFYHNGQGVAQDYRGAMYWYRKAADDGYADAQYNIGIFYHNGLGVAQDYRGAMHWYRKAADQGHAAAQSNIGSLYENGQGLARDYAGARHWYKKAAAQGYAIAQSNMGALYDSGLGVRQDYAGAMQWYGKAAAQGYAQAQYNIGVLYHNGHGVARDYGAAMQWYIKAAGQGHALAQSNLGSLYEHGQGVTKDYSTAMQWYRKAAVQGLALAQYNVALLYHNGKGVAQDYSAALQWHKKAAAQGYAGAQFQVGFIYENGQGVARNTKAAVPWYKKAASQGHAAAKLRLKSLPKS